MKRKTAIWRASFETIEQRILFSTIYVDLNSPGPSHDGTSWNQAFTDIPSALAATVAGDEVRVADGTYYPTSGTDRTVSIQLKSGVAVRGNYLGSGADNPDARTGQTILSGEIGAASNTDNSYHVLIASGTSAATVLDGITISGGNASGSNSSGGGGGIYNSAGSLTISNCLFIANAAALSGGGAIYNTGASPTITNCNFTGNSASATSSGGAINNVSSSSPTIASCTFTENSAGQSSSGGAIAFTSSSGVVQDCSFLRNQATSEGGAIESIFSAGLTIIRCKFVGNTARYAGAFNGSGSVLNSLFVGNSAYFGGAAQNNSNTSFVNCTFTGNSATAGGAIWTTSTPSQFTNCIVWGNMAEKGSDLFVGSASFKPVITYSDIGGGFSGTGNINADPMYFHAADSGLDGIWGTGDDLTDLRIAGYSPVVDAANNSALRVSITQDLTGAARRTDVISHPDTGTGGAPIVDMGAYEASSNFAASASGPYVVLSTQSLNLSGVAASNVVGAFTYEWEWTGNAQFDDAAGSNVAFPVGSFVAGSIINVSLRVTDPASQVLIVQTTVRVLSPVLYVDQHASGNGSGASWQNAFTDLKAALSLSLPGNTIRVAGGVYTPTNTSSQIETFPLKNGVGIFGGYRGVTSSNPDNRDALTTLSGEIGDPGSTADNSDFVITGTGTNLTSVLDGLTITAGGVGLYILTPMTINNCAFNSNTSYGVNYTSAQSPAVTFTNCDFSYNGAGGISGGASATITGCTFRNNNGTALAASGTVSNCTFIGNAVVGNGGAVSFGGVFTNCSFIGNSATQSGGAVYARGNPVFTNCIFRGNSAGQSGGAVYCDSTSPIFTGCSFYANSAPLGGAIGMNNSDIADSILTITNCVLVGNTASQGGAVGLNSVFSMRRWPPEIRVNNCTITSNVATASGGGIYQFNAIIRLRNSILRGNTAPLSPDRQIGGTANGVEITNSDMPGTGGPGNMDADPQFVRAPSSGADGVWNTADDDYGDLRLHSTSPCIDAGNNANIPAGITTDIAGNPRTSDVPGIGDPGVIVDIGAFEYVLPLQIAAANFDFNAAKPTLRFTLNGDADPLSIAPSDLFLFNQTTNQSINCAQVAVVSYDAATRTAIWTFPALLADGNYHAVIAPGAISSAVQTPSANQIDYDFFALAGDADRNRVVNINDLAIMANNWHGNGRTFSQGDFNYDGVVDAKDLGILSANWQKNLPLAPPAAAPVSTTRPLPTRTPVRALVL